MQFSLAFVYSLAACTKLANPTAFIDGIRRYGIVGWQSAPVWAYAVIIVEVFLAFSHFSGVLSRLGFIVGLGLLTMFVLVTTVVIVRGDKIACHCFGSSEPLSVQTLLRTLLLLGAEGTLLYLAMPIRFSALSDPVSFRQVLLSLPLACSLFVLGLWLTATPKLAFIARDLLTFQRKGHAGRWI